MTAHPEEVAAMRKATVPILRKPFDLQVFFVQLERLLYPQQLHADGLFHFDVVTPNPMVAKA